MGKDVKLTIDGVELTVPEGTLLVEAAKQIQTEIPVYCYHPKLGPAGLCRICLVDIEKMPKLQIACNTPVTDGMVVHTMNDRVNEGRRAVLELFLLNHPLDCPICDKGGECDLQDYVMAYGQGASRMADAKMSKPKAVDLGPTIVLDEERCIVCQRCVRFDEIITREQSLVVIDRGVHDIIATATDRPYQSDFSGNVTELCPVGALTSKTYRFKSRPWDLHRTATSCTQCSVGCGINVDERGGLALRTMSIESDDAGSDGWLCDRGRYNIGFYDSGSRLVTPLAKQNGSWTQIDWSDAIALWAAAIKNAPSSPAAIAALGGGRLLNEEAFLLQELMRKLGSASVDWRTGRQRQASPGKFAGTALDLETAQLIVTAGVPPSQSAPVLDLRIRKAVARHGAALFSVGPFAARAHVAERRFASVGDLRGAVPRGAQRIALIWDGRDLAAGRELAALANDLANEGKEIFTYIPGEQNNSLGAEAMGMHPAFLPGYARTEGGLDTAGIFAAARDGEVAVLSLFGVNPLARYPDRALVRAALERAPFVVATELFMTETAELADLVLPVRAGFEKDGHMYALDSRVVRVNAGLAAPDGTLSDGDIIRALAVAAGVQLTDPAQVAARASARLAAGGFGITFGDERYGQPGAPPQIGYRGQHDRALAVLVGTRIMSGAGTAHFDQRTADLRPKPVAIMSSETALACGLECGDVVDLTGELDTGLIEGLAVEIDAHAVPGTVTIIDGLSAQAPNKIRSSHAAVGNVRKAAPPELAGAAR